MTPSLRRETHWVCPHCTTTAVTHQARPHTEMHSCRGQYALWAPMVEDGVDCTVVTTERQDFIAGEIVRVDGRGRPIMSAIVQRADGSNDCFVYAPTATARSTQ